MTCHCKRQEKLNLIQWRQMKSIQNTASVWPMLGEFSLSVSWNNAIHDIETMDATIKCDRKCLHRKIYGTTCLSLCKKMKIIFHLDRWIVFFLRVLYSFVNILLLLLFMKSFSFARPSTESHELHHHVKWPHKFTGSQRKEWRREKKPATLINLIGVMKWQFGPKIIPKMQPIFSQLCKIRRGNRNNNKLPHRKEVKLTWKIITYLEA